MKKKDPPLRRASKTKPTSPATDIVLPPHEDHVSVRDRYRQHGLNVSKLRPALNDLSEDLAYLTQTQIHALTQRATSKDGSPQQLEKEDINTLNTLSQVTARIHKSVHDDTKMALELEREAAVADDGDFTEAELAEIVAQAAAALPASSDSDPDHSDEEE